jgi:hypothetical protein
MSHKISSEDVFIEYKLNGVQPTCNCGCGGKTKFLGETLGFRNFLAGHHNRVGINNFHRNPETKLKSAKTQSENWKKGMYRRWWEEDTEETKQKIEGIKEKLRNDKERGKKISKNLKGKPKSEEHKNKLSESAKNRYKNRPELIDLARKNKMVWLKDNCRVKTSKLEDKFEDILNILGLVESVDYHRNYLFENTRWFFDFYFPKYNLIIETHGDFYHCNPESKYKEAKYEIQSKNLTNDGNKKNWVLNKNIKYEIIWEKDINNNPEDVIIQLKNLLNE